jgi:hypothetical protein
LEGGILATIATLAGYVTWHAPADVENDASTAQSYPVFVQVERLGSKGGSLEFRVPSVDTAVISLGGTATSGDVVKVTLNGHETDYTYGGGDTTQTLGATHVAAALNADATFADYATAVGVGATVVITANEPGVQEEMAISVATTGGHTTAALPVGQTTLLPVNPLDALVNNSSCTITVSQ